MQHSETLELDESLTKVKRKIPLKLTPRNKECSVQLKSISPEVTLEVLTELLCQIGGVLFVYINSVLFTDVLDSRKR